MGAIVILAGLLGLIPATIAQSKGHEFLLWWIYGAAIFVVALPHALLLKPDDEGQVRAARADGRRRCDACAELIRSEATLCRYCGTEQRPQVAQ